MGSLAEDLAGAPPAVIAKPQRGKRVSPLGPDETAPANNEAPPPQETDMPRKTRAKKTGTPSLHELRDQVAAADDGAPKKPKRKYTRKATAAAPLGRAPAKHAVPVDGTRFGVFSDGTVQIDAPSCKGNLSCDDVDLLYSFVSKLREARK